MLTQYCHKLFFCWLIFSPTPGLESVAQEVPEVIQNTTPKTQSLTNKKFFRAMLKNHFPDFESRVAYQQQMEILYASGTKKLAQAKKIGATIDLMNILTVEERDAFDYINGTGVYKKFQDIKTSPNIFDTRRSFLLKMEDDKIRNKFLESYNKKEKSFD